MAENSFDIVRNAVLNILENLYQVGRIGRINPDGTTTIVVPGRNHMIYVRLGAGETTGVIEAFNAHVPRKANAPVKLMRVMRMWIVAGIDESSPALDADTYNVAYHVHTRENGLNQPVLELDGMPSSLEGAAGQYLRVRGDEKGFYLSNAPNSLVPYGTPSGEFDTGIPGEWKRDDDYLYFCYAADTWARYPHVW